MFKEQLHESFDSISPSPELLDRISAMMSEEVNKKKPPLRLQAAKYGGIAAALLFVAGGAYAAIRASDDVHYGITGSAANNAEEAYYVAGDSEAGEYIVGDYDGIAEGEAIVGAQLYESASVTAAAETTAGAVTTTAPAAAAAEAAEAGDIAAAGGIPSLSDEDAPSGNDNGRSGFVEPESFTSENPGTGDDDPYTFVFEFPFTDSFRELPDSLLAIPDGVKVYNEDGYVMGERWREYFAASNPGYDPDADEDAEPAAAGTIDTGYPDITMIDECDNAFTFILYFDISDDDVRAALANYYTDEQISALLSLDRAKITAAFASEYAIVKGEHAYAPLWLYRHSYDEWREAGITQEDILQKYDLLTHLPAEVVSQKRQDAITQKIEGFIE